MVMTSGVVRAGQGWSEPAGNGRKTIGNGRKWSEIARNCWEQLEMVSEVVRADQKRSVGREMVGKRSEMVGNGRKRSETVGND